MAKINHTFSTDSTAEFRGQPLAGVACIGGLVELDHGKRLVVQFEGPAIGPAPRRSVPVEIRADADPELFGAVKDHVLGGLQLGPKRGQGVVSISHAFVPSWSAAASASASVNASSRKAPMRAASAWLTSAAHIRFTWDGLHPASSAVLVMLWPDLRSATTWARRFGSARRLPNPGVRHHSKID